MYKLFLLVIFGHHIITYISANLTNDEIAILRRNNFTIQDNGNSWIINHHGVPDHGFDGGFGDNPNTPTVQNHSYEIPKVPIPAANGSEGCVYLGPMAMSVSGAPFYNPYTGEGKNAVEGDCKETFDHCDGHPSPDGAYHYHQLPSCLYFTNDDLRDVFLGVAFDGYAIYGPMDESGKNWTSRELDKCHGHQYKGRYVYRVTMDFPYVMSCYHGSLLFENRPGGRQGSQGGQQGRPGSTDGQNRPTDGQQQPSQNGYQLPPGYDNSGESNNCRTNVEQNWQMMTCYAFCENPGLGSFHNCGHGLVNNDDENGNDPTDSASRIYLTTWLIIASLVLITITHYI